MRTMRIYVWILLLVALIGLPMTRQAVAQDTPGARVQPFSQRYSLEVPAGWVVNPDEIWGLEGTFIGEILTIGDSAESLQSLETPDPNAIPIGQTLLANIFPTILAFTGTPDVPENPTGEQVFSTLLGPNYDTATKLEIDGLPAVQVRDYFGPPYENAAYTGQTMVVDGALIYFIVYAGEDEASLANLEAIAATLQVNPVENALIYDPSQLGTRSPFMLSDGTLQMDINYGWMVMSAGRGQVESLTVLPDPANQLTPFFSGSAGTPDGLFIQVTSQPYDTIFGTVDVEVTLDDRNAVLGQALAEVGGNPVLGAEEFTIDGALAVRLEATESLDGSYNSSIVLVDDGQAMTTLRFTARAADWDTIYKPLIDALVASIRVNEPAEMAGTIGIQIGQTAPDFTLTALDGNPISLSDFRGKTVLLNFWATWCTPCRIEMPEFQSSFEQFGAGEGDFVVLAVNLLESAEQAQVFVDELGLTFPIALDLNGDVNALYQIPGYPTSYLIDAEGTIIATNIGPISSDQIAEWVALAA